LCRTFWAQDAWRKNDGRKAQILRKIFYETELSAKAYFKLSIERKLLYEIHPREKGNLFL
jgi:hypothetical protein